MTQHMTTILDKNKTLFTAGTVVLLVAGVWWGASEASKATTEISYLKDDVLELKNIVQDNNMSLVNQYGSLEARVRQLEITCVTKK
jgi:hypothetical protein